MPDNIPRSFSFFVANCETMYIRHACYLRRLQKSSRLFLKDEYTKCCFEGLWRPSLTRGGVWGSTMSHTCGFGTSIANNFAASRWPVHGCKLGVKVIIQGKSMLAYVPLIVKYWLPTLFKALLSKHFSVISDTYIEYRTGATTNCFRHQQYLSFLSRQIRDRSVTVYIIFLCTSPYQHS